MRTFVALALACSVARADPPRLTVVVGVGARAADGTMSLGPPFDGQPPLDESQASTAALEATVGIRVSRRLGIGVHVAAATRTSASDDYGGNVYSWHAAVDTWPVDVAASMFYQAGRFWIAPWLGRQFVRVDRREEDDAVNMSSGQLLSSSVTKTRTWMDNRTSAGITIAIDVIELGSHHLALFADLQTGAFGDHTGGPDFNYSALTVGVAYHR